MSSDSSSIEFLKSLSDKAVSIFASNKNEVKISDAMNEYGKSLEFLVDLINKKGKDKNFHQIIKLQYNAVRNLALSLRIKVGGSDEILNKIAKDFNKKMKTNYDVYKVFFEVLERPIREICLKITELGIAKGECQPAYPSELSAVPLIVVGTFAIKGAFVLAGLYLSYKLAYTLSASGLAAYEQAKANRVIADKMIDIANKYEKGEITKEKYEEEMKNLGQAVKDIGSSGLFGKLLIPLMIGGVLVGGYYFIKKKGYI